MCSIVSSEQCSERVINNAASIILAQATPNDISFTLKNKQDKAAALRSTEALKWNKT